MKLSFNWLQPFIETNGLAPEMIGEKLTLHTAELEEIVYVRDFFQHVYAGKLISSVPHPTAKKLHIGKFDLGTQGVKQIVFGSRHEVKKEMVYPIALPGAKLKSGIKIKVTEIQDVKSDGMIVDNNELGFKNSNLVMFDEKDMGKELPEICPEYRDILFDIDNKSLTHRPDLMGHRGFSREITAIFNKKLVLPEPVVVLPKDQKNFPVDIKTDKCRRFCAIGFRNVKVKPANCKVQVRLENLGIKAISNVVDITNWTMLEFGQPMHAFDADKISGKIIVRMARDGEKVRALDDIEYSLTKDDIVIADEEKILSIAGIMGGRDSAVTFDTRNVVFESANFDPLTVRKTSQYLGLRSESSMRFEKSLDPYMCRPALLSATELLLQSNGEDEIKITTGITDVFPHPSKPDVIELCPQKVRTYSGIVISDDEITQKLKSLGFSVSVENNKLYVIPPSYRATKDISIAEDLIEEIVRLHGFFDIAPMLPALSIKPPKPNLLRNMEWEIKEFISANGYMEILGYSFVNEKDSGFTGSDEYIKITNPLSEEHTSLRRSLISNQVKNIESELRTHGRLDFFEFGKVFIPNSKTFIDEILHFSLLTAIIGGNENDIFYTQKDHLSLLFDHLGLSYEFQPHTVPLYYAHPSKSAQIIINNIIIGTIGVLHPSCVPEKNTALVFSEINAEQLLEELKKVDKKYKKISPFPSVHRDLSIVLNERTLIADIQSTAQQSSEMLKEIVLFDEYSDSEKLGPGLKNLAFHLKFQSDKKTLEEQAIETSYHAIVKALEKNHNARLRIEFDQEKSGH